MYQFLLADLPGRFVKPRNLLPTGVKIASNKHHRRLLLPSQASWSSNYRVPGIETEPSLLSNQPFVSKGGFTRTHDSVFSADFRRNFFLISNFLPLTSAFSRSNDTIL